MANLKSKTFRRMIQGNEKTVIHNQNVRRGAERS